MDINILVEIAKDIGLFIIGFIFYVINRYKLLKKIDKINTKNAILDNLPELIDKNEKMIKGDNMGEMRKFCLESDLKGQFAINHLPYNENEIKGKIEAILKAPQATCYKQANCYINDNYVNEEKGETENGKENEKSEIRPADLFKHSEENKEN